MVCYYARDAGRHFQQTIVSRYNEDNSLKPSLILNPHLKTDGNGAVTPNVRVTHSDHLELILSGPAFMV